MIDINAFKARYGELNKQHAQPLSQLTYQERKEIEFLNQAIALVEMGFDEAKLTKIKKDLQQAVNTKNKEIAAFLETLVFMNQKEERKVKAELRKAYELPLKVRQIRFINKIIQPQKNR